MKINSFIHWCKRVKRNRKYNNNNPTSINIQEEKISIKKIRRKYSKSEMENNPNKHKDNKQNVVRIRLMDKN